MASGREPALPTHGVCDRSLAGAICTTRKSRVNTGYETGNGRTGGKKEKEMESDTDERKMDNKK